MIPIAPIVLAVIAASPYAQRSRNGAPRKTTQRFRWAWLVLLLVVSVQTIMLFDKVRATYLDHVLTYDLNLPTWPFFAVAWLGDVSAVLLIAVRTWRLVFRPDQIGRGPNLRPIE